MSLRNQNFHSQMYLFKSSGATYRRVVKQAAHAYGSIPRLASHDEFVLLSKNKEDCALTERQIQHAAKILNFREATPAELEAMYPDVHAGERFRYVADLYWVRPLSEPFSLSQVRGLNEKHYRTVQGFARLSHEDSLALLDFLSRTNAAVVLDFLGSAERPSEA